jgi:hypothetical protein
MSIHQFDAGSESPFRELLVSLRDVSHLACTLIS